MERDPTPRWLAVLDYVAFWTWALVTLALFIGGVTWTWHLLHEAITVEHVFMAVVLCVIGPFFVMMAGLLFVGDIYDDLTRRYRRS
jgi:hypothetical protein